MRVPEDGGFVVVALRVQRGAEGWVVLRVVASAAAAAAAGPVVDGAEGGGGEGGEDAGVLGDVSGRALAAAQAGRDEVVGVLAVDLGAGRAAGRAAVVAADEELAGREGRGRRLERGRFRRLPCGRRWSVALHPDGPLQPPRPESWRRSTGQGAAWARAASSRERGRGGAGKCGSPSDGHFGRGGPPGRRVRDSVGRPGGAGRRSAAVVLRSRERRTTAATATEMAVMATAARSAERGPAPPTGRLRRAPGEWRPAGSGAPDRGGGRVVGAVGVWGGGVGLSGSWAGTRRMSCWLLARSCEPFRRRRRTRAGSMAGARKVRDEPEAEEVIRTTSQTRTPRT